MRLAASAEEGAGLVIALCLPGSQAPASQASGFGSAPFFRRPALSDDPLYLGGGAFGRFLTDEDHLDVRQLVTDQPHRFAEPVNLGAGQPLSAIVTFGARTPPSAAATANCGVIARSRARRGCQPRSKPNGHRSDPAGPSRQIAQGVLPPRTDPTGPRTHGLCWASRAMIAERRHIQPPEPRTSGSCAIQGSSGAKRTSARACRLAQPNKSRETKSLPNMGEARDTYLLNDYNSTFSEILSAALSSVSR